MHCVLRPCPPRNTAAAAGAGVLTSRLPAHGPAAVVGAPWHPHPSALLVCSPPSGPAVAQGAAGSLNFPASDYPGERQRFGPDLAAYLLQLGWAACCLHCLPTTRLCLCPPSCPSATCPAAYLAACLLARPCVRTCLTWLAVFSLPAVSLPCLLPACCGSHQHMHANQATAARPHPCFSKNPHMLLPLQGGWQTGFGAQAQAAGKEAAAGAGCAGRCQGASASQAPCMHDAAPPPPRLLQPALPASLLLKCMRLRP